MGLFEDIKRLFRPLRLTDPEFGSIRYAGRYWEAQWEFPNTKTKVFIPLEGDEIGPFSEARQFYLGLPERFDEILIAARPMLQENYTIWFEKELPEDILQVLTLTGFRLEWPVTNVPQWEISFETTGDKWISISVYFLGDKPYLSSVDT